MVAAGLVEDRLVQQLGPFIDAYVESRCDVKPATELTWQRAKNHLLGFFDANRDLSTITEAEAEDWERWMRYKRDPCLSVNTVRKSVSIAKQWFKAAIKRRLITSNPFQGLSGSVGGNPERMQFITRDEAARVLAACPDAEWRLIFALARFGGRKP